MFDTISYGGIISVIVKMFYSTFAKILFTNIRNGISASNAIASFTAQSAIASETQSGTSGPTVRSGDGPHAHEISLFADSEKN